MAAVQLVTVTKEEAGQKLLNYLQRRVGKEVPKSALQKAIRKGWVRVDKGRKKAFDRLKEGQIVRIPPFHTEDKPEQKVPAPKNSLHIIHESEDVLVLSKPCGLPVHRGTNNEDSMADRVKAQYIDAPFRPSPAHRLDKNTSGVLLFGKSYTSLRSLQDQFADHSAEKIYLAWVHGNWNLTEPSVLKDSLEKKTAEDGREKMHTGSGKESRCIVQPMEQREDWTLMAVKLLTGRTHQIRVQLSDRGHPIAGDVKYGAPKMKNLPAPLLLHAAYVRVKEGEWAIEPAWTGPWKVDNKKLKSLSKLFINMH